MIIDELRSEIKGDVGRWEEVVVEWAQGIARYLAGGVLAALDEELMRERNPGLKVVGFRSRCITGLFGDLEIKRRLYRDKEGHHHYLLDELLGLRQRCHVSDNLERLATLLCSYMSFGASAEVLAMMMPEGLSRTTIHRLVGRVVDPGIEEERREVEELFTEGVLPESEGRIVSHLMVEADGTSIALQREGQRRGEIKVGAAYEGWEAVGENRYRVKNKTTYAGMMDGESFWEAFSLQLNKKYELGRIGNIAVGGDGASWVKDGAEILGGTYQLDRFHLLRALFRALRDDQAKAVYEACISGDMESVEMLLNQAHLQARGEAIKEIVRLRNYLRNNASGLKDYRLAMDGEGLRGMGTIESNVDKSVAMRMKKRGMAWTKIGGHRMARMIAMRQKGLLGQPSRNEYGDTLDSPPPVKRNRFRLRPDPVGPSEDKYRLWIEAGLPALSGPHVNRPWVRVLLKMSSFNNINCS